MTATVSTIEALYAAVAAHPAEPTARMVLADALDEFGDDRQRALAAGYRALAACGKWSWGTPIWFGWMKSSGHKSTDETYYLPRDWFVAVFRVDDHTHKSHTPSFLMESGHGFLCYHTPRQAEDAAALAVSRLPDWRQAELLAGVEAESGEWA